MIKNHGVEYPAQNKNIHKKMRETTLKNHNVEYPAQNKNIHKKIRETTLKNHNVEYPMQNSDIFAKQKASSYSMKEYKFPSGRIIQVQGYEGFCIDDLLRNGIDENDIKSGYDLSIQYSYEGKTHIYYPDLHLPKQNKIIEVKSTYTFEKEEEKNLAKMKACKDLGYDTEIRIYGSKGELLEII